MLQNTCEIVLRASDGLLFCERVIELITFQIFIGIPKLEQRKEILDVLVEGINLADEVQLNKLAEATPGYTGADLASIVQQAVLDAYVRAADKV